MYKENDMAEAVTKNNDITVKTVGVVKEYQMGGNILRALKGTTTNIGKSGK